MEQLLHIVVAVARQRHRVHDLAAAVALAGVLEGREHLRLHLDVLARVLLPMRRRVGKVINLAGLEDLEQYVLGIVSCGRGHRRHRARCRHGRVHGRQHPHPGLLGVHAIAHMVVDLSRCAVGMRAVAVVAQVVPPLPAAHVDVFPFGLQRHGGARRRQRLQRLRAWRGVELAHARRLRSHAGAGVHAPLQGAAGLARVAGRRVGAVTARLSDFHAWVSPVTVWARAASAAATASPRTPPPAPPPTGGH
ncbi:hypothetical protein D3C81_1136650 [compost metagenome]